MQWNHVSAYMNGLTLIQLTWRTGWAPDNASKFQMGCNSAFTGLMERQSAETILGTCYRGTVGAWTSLQCIKRKSCEVCFHPFLIPKATPKKKGGRQGKYKVILSKLTHWLSMTYCSCSNQLSYHRIQLFFFFTDQFIRCCMFWRSGSLSRGLIFG
jgi:hypothetical protein